MINQPSSGITEQAPGNNLPGPVAPAPGPIGVKKPRSRRWVRNRSTLAGGIIVAVIILIAVVSLFWTPHFYDEQDLNRSLLPPFWMDGADPGYPLGTDLNGRDLLSRLMVGSQASLFVGVASVLVGGIIGMILGLIAGFFGGWWDAIIMRLVDIQLSLPGVLLAIAVLAAIGKGLLNVVLVLGFVSWVQYARIVRGSTLAVKSQEFVLGATAIGAKSNRVILKHILPNILPPLMVVATINVSSNILSEAALSYLGVGVNISTVTWGGMLNEGKTLFDVSWWNAVWPGLAILIVVFGINLLGDGLSEGKS
jgi:peptide/nickel transport system permease protein